MTAGRIRTAAVLAILLCLIPVKTAWIPLPPGLEVHFLDVGQGDCAIVVCEGEAMVIDGGPGSASAKVYSYIRNTLGLESIRLVTATHPHEDHIGGLSAVLNAAPVGLILTPVTEYDSPQFDSLLRYADKQGTEMVVPRDGDTYALGSARVSVVICWPEAWVENDMSIVLRLDYGETSFLFTGDAESMLEYMMIDSGMDLSADVLKVGHHGSFTSSTTQFLQAVSPGFAVLSCGRDNPYGHPQQETLDRLAAAGAAVLRTDEAGTVVFTSDGKELSCRTEKPCRDAEGLTAFPTLPPEAGKQYCYLGNKGTHKFHSADCSYGQTISSKNLVFFDSREEAIAAGYTPCSRCSP